MSPSAKYVVLSNGHGEDLVARRVCSALFAINPALHLQVFPLVGHGVTYKRHLSSNKNFTLLEPTKIFPSGGFCFTSLRWLIADLRCGLIPFFIIQFKTIINSTRDQSIIILAVGDFLPLLLAWLTGRNYVYIHTKKSDHMWLHSRPRPRFFWFRLLGSNWNLCEILLSRSSRCISVFTRDAVSAHNLLKYGIKAFAANPMMDSIALHDPSLVNLHRPSILCLPGSRINDIRPNLLRLLRVVKNSVGYHSFPLSIYIPLASKSHIAVLVDIVQELFPTLTPHYVDSPSFNLPVSNHTPLDIYYGVSMLKHWTAHSPFALSMAGTATEQVAGAGVKVFSIPGDGAQFNFRFAKRQQRLLGDIVTICRSEHDLIRLLAQSIAELRAELYVSPGRCCRMYSSGSSRFIASTILELGSMSPL